MEDSLNKKLLLEKESNEGNLENLATQIAKVLSQKNPFVLWLEGDLGAGKTTFTRYVLRALGLNPRLPVTSPTYGFVNDYDLDSGRVAHMDMYRGDAHIQEIGLDVFDDYIGFIVEWPKEGESRTILPPTHHLEIKIKEANDMTSRTYAFSEIE